MLKIISDYFLRYAKNTPVRDIIIHTVLFLITVSWISVTAIFVLNFSALSEMYTQYTGAKVVKIENALVVSEQVQDIISSQRGDMDIDRLYISKFHNGKTDLNGVHFIFFSRVSESDNAGVANEMQISQNIPLSIFPGMVTALAHKTCYTVQDTKKAVNSAYLESQGINSLIVCPILTGSGSLIGIVGAEGVIHKINNTHDKVKVQMQILSKILGPIISAGK